jgi:hypothetical protein
MTRAACAQVCLRLGTLELGLQIIDHQEDSQKIIV